MEKDTKETNKRNSKIQSLEEYVKNLETDEENGISVDFMKIMSAVAQIKAIRKIEGSIKRSKKEETIDKKKQSMDEMSEQLENSLLDEDERKELKLANLEKGTRFTISKEKILEQLSKQIDSLKENIKQTRDISRKQATKDGKSEVEVELEDMSYDPVNELLNLYSKYVKKQMPKISKKKDKEESEVADSVLIVNDASSEIEEKNEESLEEGLEENKTEDEEKAEDEEKTEQDEKNIKEEVDKNSTEAEEKAEDGNAQTQENKDVEQPSKKSKKSEQQNVVYVQNTEPQNVQKEEQTQDLPDAREPVDEKQKKENNVESVEKQNTSTASEKEETTKNELQKGNSMEQLQGFAKNVVLKSSQGKKAEDVLKESSEIDKIAEEIQKGNITINDVKKAINDKSVKETGKTNEKLATTVGKYLAQRANSINSSYVTISFNNKDLIAKKSLWDKIKDSFKNIGNKIKGIFSRKPVERDDNMTQNTSNTKNEFLERTKIENSTPKKHVIIGDKQVPIDKCKIVYGAPKNVHKRTVDENRLFEDKEKEIGDD